MASNIGILGGTFNPIHLGHLRIAEELAESLQLEEVRFTPSANPPHKPIPKVSAAQRAEMVGLAIKDNSKFVLDAIELTRDSASFTIDTLISLRESIGKATSLNLIMGSDAFIHFDTWHRWKEILQYCHIVLIQRPPIATVANNPLNSALEGLLSDHYCEEPTTLQNTPNGFIHMQAVTALSISSTDIRQRLQAHQSIRYLTSNAVIDYIHLHQLYTL